MKSNYSLFSHVFSGPLTISSPPGVGVGFKNPTFACLEVDYEEADNDDTDEAAANTRKVYSISHSFDQYAMVLI